MPREDFYHKLPGFEFPNGHFVSAKAHELGPVILAAADGNLVTAIIIIEAILAGLMGAAVTPAGYAGIIAIHVESMATLMADQQLHRTKAAGNA